MKDDVVLKNNVKEIRLEKNITQQELAQTIGVSRNTISSIENGQYCPNAKLALLICKTFDKKFEDLFFI